jgi:hypothetical protein
MQHFLDDFIAKGLWSVLLPSVLLEVLNIDLAHAFGQFCTETCCVYICALVVAHASDDRWRLSLSNS